MVLALPQKESITQKVTAALAAAAPYAKTALHVGYIPLIIYLGMTTTEPRPSLAQLLGPM